METPNEQAQIAQFLTDVFTYMDRTVEFTHRPMSTENRWLPSGAPIVQVIFPEDVIAIRPIDTNFVTAYGMNQIFSRDDFVNAAVAVLQTRKEVDIAEPILRYVDTLVETYRSDTEIPPVEPEKTSEIQPTFELGGKSNGWK